MYSTVLSGGRGSQMSLGEAQLTQISYGDSICFWLIPTVSTVSNCNKIYKLMSCYLTPISLILVATLIPSAFLVQSLFELWFLHLDDFYVPSPSSSSYFNLYFSRFHLVFCRSHSCPSQIPNDLPSPAQSLCYMCLIRGTKSPGTDHRAHAREVRGACQDPGMLLCHAGGGTAGSSCFPTAVAGDGTPSRSRSVHTTLSPLLPEYI